MLLLLSSTFASLSSLGKIILLTSSPYSAFFVLHLILAVFMDSFDKIDESLKLQNESESNKQSVHPEIVEEHQKVED